MKLSRKKTCMGFSLKVHWKSATSRETQQFFSQKKVFSSCSKAKGYLVSLGYKEARSWLRNYFVLKEWSLKTLFRAVDPDAVVAKRWIGGQKNGYTLNNYQFEPFLPDSDAPKVSIWKIFSKNRKIFQKSTLAIQKRRMQSQMAIWKTR